MSMGDTFGRIHSVIALHALEGATIVICQGLQGPLGLITGRSRK